MLPPAENDLIDGLQRKQDAIIAELYAAKITFGEYNIKMNQIMGDYRKALSGIPQPTSATNSAVRSSKKTAEVQQSPPEPRIPTGTRDTQLASHDVRIALVIGNSGYSNLTKLSNTANDAQSIADALKKLGYSTRLVLDAPEQVMRQEVRTFANQSNKADVALVFYAGHGAQVNGENYVLPVDIEIPQTETDIQLTGLKVDDLVNSIHSRTKIVFLDACRDNPALFKNLVKGRGAYAAGLAPANGSNLQALKSGGGVFIAYATDSGAVALDGSGPHSPFTQALLRNIEKQISIDDMFSLVTKEVRLVTRNAQRPYKYASLENIICLARSCSTTVADAPDVSNLIEESRRSELEERQIALQSDKAEALEAY
jgi:hypothetical protein